MSTHAEKRAKQRGIPPVIVQWLEDFGERTYDHRGAVITYFTKRARRRLERAVGRQVIRHLGNWMDCYAVRSVDGNLVTVGHRFQRILN